MWIADTAALASRQSGIDGDRTTEAAQDASAKVLLAISNNDTHGYLTQVETPR